MPPGPTADAAAQLEAVRDVLRAISRSPFDLEAVLAIVVERMARLCHADQGLVFVPAGEGLYQGVASWNATPEHSAYTREHLIPVTNGTIVGRTVLSGDVSEVEDAASDPAYTWRDAQRLGGFRTVLGVPMRREDRLIGVAVLARTVVRRFSPDEIELVRTFIDLAAIVIDNVRGRSRACGPTEPGRRVGLRMGAPILAGSRHVAS